MKFTGRCNRMDNPRRGRGICMWHSIVVVAQHCGLARMKTNVRNVWFGSKSIVFAEHNFIATIVVYLILCLSYISQFIFCYNLLFKTLSIYKMFSISKSYYKFGFEPQKYEYLENVIAKEVQYIVFVTF